MKGLLFFCGLLLWSVSLWAGFIESTDIPLMDGLQINESDSFSFDTPEGQIMMVQAQTESSPREVLTFYQAALKELGWQQKSATTYQRDQDLLVLQVVSQKQKTILKIQYTFANK